jgi:hypothetical protein
MEILLHLFHLSFLFMDVFSSKHQMSYYQINQLCLWGYCFTSTPNGLSIGEYDNMKSKTDNSHIFGENSYISALSILDKINKIIMR